MQSFIYFKKYGCGSSDLSSVFFDEKEKYSEHITLSEIMIWSLFCEISAPSGQGSEKRTENDQRTRKTFLQAKTC